MTDPSTDGGDADEREWTNAVCRHPTADRSSAENAQLALLLEVASTPKPGCVDREREYPDLRFEHFQAGVVGARPGLEMAAAGEPVGVAFRTAVEGMANQSAGNTHFGALLLLVALVRAAANGECTPAGVRSVVEATTVDDAAAFYRAFDAVDVFVADPPAEATALDVRRGGDAIGTLRERGFSLRDVMALGEARDDVAREWIQGFPRSFRMAARLAGEHDEPAAQSPGDRPGDQRPETATAASATSLTDRGARAFVGALAERPDTLVAAKHSQETARAVSERAEELLSADRSRIEAWADDLVEAGINPGTTADILAAGYFIALERESVTV